MWAMSTKVMWALSTLFKLSYNVGAYVSNVHIKFVGIVHIRTDDHVPKNTVLLSATFKVPGCPLLDAGCLSHTLQLVIKADCFELPSVKALLTKCRDLVSFANQSTNFYTELYKNEELLMGIVNQANRKNLKQDVVTR